MKIKIKHFVQIQFHIWIYKIKQCLKTYQKIIPTHMDSFIINHKELQLHNCHQILESYNICAYILFVATGNPSYMDSSFSRKYPCPTPVSDTYSDIGMTLRSFKYMEKLTKIEQYPCRTHTRIRHPYPSPSNIAFGYT